MKVSRSLPNDLNAFGRGPRSHRQYAMSRLQSKRGITRRVFVWWGSRTHPDPAVKLMEQAAGEPTHIALDSSGYLILYKI